MTSYFASRHPGAQEWAQRKGYRFTHYISHLDSQCLEPGDLVAGSLPPNLACEVAASGATYLHLAMRVPEHLRGKELNAEQMEACGAELRAYRIEELPIGVYLSALASPSE